MNLKKDQRGINMIGLIIWMVLAVVILGGGTALFVSTSQQTAVAAEQTNQQQSILNALNRASRDVSVSNPIVYASATDIVMDIETAAGNVERRRYMLDTTAKQVVEMTKTIARGEPYDPASTSYWSSPQRSAVDVYRVKIGATPFLSYFDKDSTALTAAMTGSAATSSIARVDIAVTADVANKGNVSLSTSAVPRATQNLGGNAPPPVAVCPAFTATRSGTDVVINWSAAAGATGYEVTSNGTTINKVTVTDPAKASYTYTDTPGQSSTVLNYMLKVISAGGIANCIDTVQPIVVQTGATQLTAALVPATTLDGTGAPTATAWSSAADTTKVSLSWPKVLTANGYVIFKQKVDASGNLVGDRATVATLDTAAYTASTAPATLNYVATTGWEEQWEWTIKVLARTGDNDSTPAIRTLSYPHPADTASVKATNYGENTVTWTYTEGINPRGFDIYRSALDAPATNFPAGFTKVASVNAGIFSYTDKAAALGSTYGYYVVAKNSSGFGNSYASKLLQQLQFPPDPVMVAPGANGSRDMADGTNRLMWAASKSATGYHVQRANFDATQVLCLSATNCGVNSGGLASTATSFIDSRTDVTPATQFNYVAFAYNATGLSPRLSAQVALTQRPVAPTLSITAVPTLSSTVTALAWNANAGQWCVSGAYSGTGTGNCSYEQVMYNNAGAASNTQGGYGTSINFNADWGKHLTFTVRSRNEAITNSGWSDYSNRPASDTYPGPFSMNAWLGTETGNNQQRIAYTSKIEYGGWGDQSVTGYTTASWGQSIGAQSIKLVRNSLDSRNAVNASDSSVLLPDTVTPTITWNGSTMNVNGTVYSSSYSPGAAAGTSAYIAAPGAVYSYTATTTSVENSLTRTVQTGSFQTPADLPQSGLLRVVCSGPAEPTGNTYVAWPRQKITSRLDGYNVAARYGKSYSTKIWRFNQYAENGPYYQDQPVIELYHPGAATSGPWYNASGGVGYYHGVGSAWQLQNVGLDWGPNSATLNISMYSIATFSDCAPEGVPVDQMWEPADACYDYTGGVCNALNDSKRPRWLTK